MHFKWSVQHQFIHRYVTQVSLFVVLLLTTVWTIFFTICSCSARRLFKHGLCSDNIDMLFLILCSNNHVCYHLQECVKRRAMKSVVANPYCSKIAAKEAVEAVWDICYNDTKPFDRDPWDGLFFASPAKHAYTWRYDIWDHIHYLSQYCFVTFLLLINQETIVHSMTGTNVAWVLWPDTILWEETSPDLCCPPIFWHLICVCN